MSTVGNRWTLCALFSFSRKKIKVVEHSKLLIHFKVKKGLTENDGHENDGQK